MSLRSPDVRPAAVAGLFYAGSAGVLSRDVDDALRLARHVSPRPPKALLAPHAGYVYSGSIAACAYASLAGSATSIERVVIVGPCHRVPVDGIAVPRASEFATPLGSVRVDREAVASIADLPQVVVSDHAHAREHAIEVQLPFLQRALSGFTIVPLAVGDATPDEVADVLERLWGGRETLVVVSSDLSHYHAYDDARKRDAATLRAVLALDPRIDHAQACGATPIAGFLTLAARRNLVASLLDAGNSGDTAGDKARVVGYASIAFHEREPAAEADDDDARGTTLLALARGTIGAALGGPAMPAVRGDWLDRPRATFVTLRQHFRLRGCVGSLAPRRPLREDVVGNARAAAFADPRFAPLTASELDHTRVEVSVLGTPERIAFDDRDALLAQLRPGLDGLIVTGHGRRATFLPQVWEQVGEPERFVDELLRKAGLDAGCPVASCRFDRYRVRKWVEPTDRGGER